jgi:hypothetical protein
MADISINGTFKDASVADYALCTQFARINIALPADGTPKAATVSLVDTGAKTPFGDSVFRIDVGP